MSVVVPVVAGPDATSADLWLERVRRDPANTNAGFRVAHMIAAGAKNGILRATPAQMAVAAGTSVPTISMCLARLAARRYLAVRRGRPGRPTEITILMGRVRA